jgi:hypothetical protein
MALTPKRFAKRVADTRIIDFSLYVPFHMVCAVCEHTLVGSIGLAIDPVDVEKHVPGYGAIYRITGDGASVVLFEATFKKTAGSGDMVVTAGVLNLITFMFDGVDYWYNITQAQ